MKKAKLRKLAKFLRENVKDSWFDLDHWAEAGFEEKECGTTACAGGWATQAFPRSGLRLVYDEYDHGLLEVEYKGEKGFDALASFFDISLSDSERLFFSGSYPPDHRGRRSVARAIERFIGDR